MIIDCNYNCDCDCDRDRDRECECDYHVGNEHIIWWRGSWGGVFPTIFLFKFLREPLKYVRPSHQCGHSSSNLPWPIYAQKRRSKSKIFYECKLKNSIWFWLTNGRCRTWILGHICTINNHNNNILFLFLSFKKIPLKKISKKINDIFLTCSYWNRISRPKAYHKNFITGYKFCLLESSHLT